ncbi:hypothetical protein DFH11DRAFT_1577205, partial [Phellopilus nigrolimitatus]
MAALRLLRLHGSSSAQKTLYMYAPTRIIFSLLLFSLSRFLPCSLDRPRFIFFFFGFPHARRLLSSFLLLLCRLALPCLCLALFSRLCSSRATSFTSFLPLRAPTHTIHPPAP